jgi:phage-related baseplate assembly protein
MTAFTKIDLSTLPFPNVTAEQNFDEILQEITTNFKQDNLDLADIVAFESDPMTAQHQALAYRVFIKQRGDNAAAKAVLLAFSSGGNLDHLAALIPLTRFDGESDDDFRARIQLAPESFSTAGSKGSYISIAVNADPSVKDAFVLSPSPGVVELYILPDVDNVTPELLQILDDRFDDDTRSMNDDLRILAFEDIHSIINAHLTLLPGPGGALVLSAARAALDAYLLSRRGFGRKIYVSGILSALFVSGVESVNLISPAADIFPQTTEVVVFDTITIEEAA